MYILYQMLCDFRTARTPPRSSKQTRPRQAARANVFLANFNGLFTCASRIQIGPDMYLCETRTPSGTPRDETPEANYKRCRLGQATRHQGWCIN